MSTISISNRIRELTMNTLDPCREPYINGRALSSFGEDGQEIIVVSTRISEPIKKIDKTEMPGMSGLLDNSYAVFPTPRFEDRKIEIRFIINASDKCEALKVVDLINEETVMQRTIDLRVGEDLFKYTGSCDKGVKVDQELRGILRCTLELEVYPFAILLFDDLVLWDDVDLETFYFNDYTYYVPANSSLTNKFIQFNQEDKPPEIRILVSGGDIRLTYLTGDGATKNIDLAEGMNYLLTDDLNFILPFGLINSSNSGIQVVFSFAQEVLRDV